jgi:VCBS repeat protein/FG-GAP repeat protein
VSRRSRGGPSKVDARRCAALFILTCTALAVGGVALSASARAPSFGRLILETDDGASAAMDDLNHDGRTDIVIASYNPESVTVALNAGGGRFRNGGTYNVGGLARSVAINDVNGDGKPDVVTANYGVNPPDTITVLLNGADGRFARRRDYQVGREPAALAVADLNGDDKPDLAIASDITNTVQQGRRYFLARDLVRNGASPCLPRDRRPEWRPAARSRHCERRREHHLRAPQPGRRQLRS